MAQLFLLNVSDGQTTATFFSTSQSGTRLQLADGGFQVGLPKTKRSFGVLRPGIGIMSQEEKDARECTIKFSVYANSRGDITSELAKINSILKNVSQRAKTGRGERVELKYSWEGSNKATFLEVYGGELIYPDNVWSVEGMHAEIGDQFVIPNLELKLWLSQEAYAISLRSTSMTAVPLSNSYGSGNTSGLKVVNTGTNYVEISSNAIDGDTPVPTKIEVAAGVANFSWFKRLYIGLQRENQFYSSAIYDSDDMLPLLNFGSTYGGGYGGNYQGGTHGGPTNTAPLGTMGWSWGALSAPFGLSLAILQMYHTMGTEAKQVSMSVGYAEFTTYGISVAGDWFTMENGMTSQPLGLIDVPPGPPELQVKGMWHSSLTVVISVATTAPTYFTADYLNFIPVGDGMRIWNVRESTEAGWAIDDGWEGIQYLQSGATIWTPFYGMLSPIKLIPGENQRLYFASGGSVAGDHQRELRIKASYVPTYTTMVE